MVTIIAVIAGAAIPRINYLLDAIAVRASAGDAMAMLDFARHTAMTREARVNVEIDSGPARLTLRAGDDTIQEKNEGAINGVHFAASRATVIYSQLGMGFGVSNLTLIVSRGAAAETVTVSRLGRVRQ